MVKLERDINVDVAVDGFHRRRPKPLCPALVHKLIKWSYLLVTCYLLVDGLAAVSFEYPSLLRNNGRRRS